MTMIVTEPKVQLSAHAYGALNARAASHLTLTFLFHFTGQEVNTQKYILNTNEGSNGGNVE